MNITESNIIKGTEDLFWETLPQLNEMEPKPVLVISSVFTNAKMEQDQLDAMVKAGCKLHETQYGNYPTKDGLVNLRKKLGVEYL